MSGENIQSRKIRVGIIGCGGIAEDHVEHYMKRDDVEIVAGADIVPGKAKAFMERYGLHDAKCYSSHKELVDDESLHLDAVSVCTYNTQHAPCAIYALEHGLNVLCEKPMSVTLDEAVAMCRAEKKSGKILSIGFQPRFDAGTQQVKKVVQSGILGKVYYVQTGGGRRSGIPGGTFIRKETAGIGAIGDIGCYGLDMVLNAIGYPKPLTVTGYTSDFFGKWRRFSGDMSEVFDVDDFAASFTRLEGGIILDFRISWAMQPETTGDSLIFGTEGALRIPSTECWNGGPGGPLVLYHDDEQGRQVQTVLDPEPGNVSCWDGKIGKFIEAVRDGGKAPVPTSEIIYNQAIIDYTVRSSKCKHELTVEIPEI